MVLIIKHRAEIMSEIYKCVIRFRGGGHICNICFNETHLPRSYIYTHIQTYIVNVIVIIVF